MRYLLLILWITGYPSHITMDSFSSCIKLGRSIQVHHAKKQIISIKCIPFEVKKTK